MHVVPDKRLLHGLLPAVFLLWTSAAVAQSYTVDYTYDAQGRLTQAAYSTAFTVSYQYDAAGNLLAVGLDDRTPTEAEPAAGVPARFALHASYPNPANPSATLHFDLPEPAEVRVTLYDVLGRRVLVVPGQQMEAGFGRTLPVDASALASGVYLYRVTARGEARTITQAGRMVVLK